MKRCTCHEVVPCIGLNGLDELFVMVSFISMQKNHAFEMKRMILRQLISFLILFSSSFAAVKKIISLNIKNYYFQQHVEWVNRQDHATVILVSVTVSALIMWHSIFHLIFFKHINDCFFFQKI